MLRLYHLKIKKAVPTNSGRLLCFYTCLPMVMFCRKNEGLRCLNNDVIALEGDVHVFVAVFFEGFFDIGDEGGSGSW